MSQDVETVRRAPTIEDKVMVLDDMLTLLAHESGPELSQHLSRNAYLMTRLREEGIWPPPPEHSEKDKQPQ